MLLTLSSILLTVISVSPVKRSCSPRNSSILRLSGRCTSVICGSSGLAKSCFRDSPSGNSSGFGLSTFGSTTCSCATLATFGRAISRPLSEVGFRVRFFSSQFSAEEKFMTETVVSSMLILTLLSATRLSVMGYGVERFNGPLSSSFTGAAGGIFLVSMTTLISFNEISFTHRLLSRRQPSLTARWSSPAFTAMPG